MKKLLIALFIAPLLSASIPSVFCAPESTPRTVEARLALESSLEKRLRSLLTEVLGTEDVIVLINVDLRSEQESAAEEVMPGVPLKETAAVSGPLGATLTMVKRIQATIIVDRDTQEADVQMLRKVTGGLLGIAPDRQDAIIIEKMAFRKAPARVEKLWSPERISMLLWLLLAAVTVGLLYGGFLRNFLGIGRDVAAALRAQASSQDSAAAEAKLDAAYRPSASANGSGAGASQNHHEAKPFSFLREEHLPKLIYLLREGSVDHLATLAHYLPPELAFRFLSAQSKEVREHVAQYLARVTELDEKVVRDMEQWVRSRIDFLVGGEQKLVEILENSPPDVQQDILATLGAQNPALKAKLENQIIRLEDIGRMESGELQILLRSVPMASLAQVLRQKPEMAEAVLGRLTAGFAERLKQELALAREMPQQQLEEETVRLLGTVKRLVREGRITISKSAPPQAEAPPQSMPRFD